MSRRTSPRESWASASASSCRRPRNGVDGNGQIRPVETLERRKSSLAELIDPLGLGEILQAVIAEVAEPAGPDELDAVEAEISTWPP